jgi:hypothetical protein
VCNKGIEFRFLGGVRDLFLLQIAQTGSYAYPVSYPVGKRGSSCRGKGARAVKLYLVPRTRMLGAVCSLPILLNGVLLSQKKGKLCFSLFIIILPIN